MGWNVSPCATRLRKDAYDGTLEGGEPEIIHDQLKLLDIPPKLSPNSCVYHFNEGSRG
jgi:hypothetical protein